MMDSTRQAQIHCTMGGLTQAANQSHMYWNGWRIIPEGLQILLENKTLPFALGFIFLQNFKATRGYSKEIYISYVCISKLELTLSSQ